MRKALASPHWSEGTHWKRGETSLCKPYGWSPN